MSKAIGYYVNGAIPQSLEDSIAASDTSETSAMYIDLFEGKEDIRIPAAFDQDSIDYLYQLEGERKNEFLRYLSNFLHG